ncbi:helix-turn-helix domain-containing protein [Actinokineospora sp. NBRC 105648]|uniref:helix-turn-helix domain-containing protein n=1 Tax=Actinokineospora sp. NBRC 105648 TaxID=3032206 RepID=UPI00331866EA
MKNKASSNSRCLLSIAEVAWLLGVDSSRVCRAIRLGVLPVVRRGRRVLVPAHVVAHLALDAGALVVRGEA